MHSPGRLRFCGWLCQDGYREDRWHGLLTLPRSFAEAGCCMYCGACVPTHAERREDAARAHATESPS
jgi:hypothetical protein